MLIIFLVSKSEFREEDYGLKNNRRFFFNKEYTHFFEKETATHSSVLAWKIPGTGVPGGLPSLGSHRVGHD